MCFTRLAGNAGCKNDAKNRHLRTIAQFCLAISSQIRHTSTIGKKLLNRNISSTCPYNMMNFGPLAAEIDWRVRSTPSNFQQVSRFGFVTAATSLKGVNQTLSDVCPSPGLVHYIYIFGGSCPLTAFCHVQNSLCVQVLRSPILAALLHSTPAVGVSQTLRRGTRNGITDVLQRAPPIFDRAAINVRDITVESCCSRKCRPKFTKLLGNKCPLA